MDQVAIAARIAQVLTQAGLAVAFTVLSDGGGSGESGDGAECTGVRTSLKRADVNLDAGLAGHYEFSLLVPWDQLSAVTLEPRRTKIRIGAAVYRLLATDADALGTSFRLHLGGTLQ